MVAECFVFL